MKLPLHALGDFTYAVWTNWYTAKPEGMDGIAGHSVITADFRQNGTQVIFLSIYVAPTDYEKYPETIKPVKGRVYFFEQVGPYNGRQTKFKDVTSEFISDTSGCISIGRMLVSDYNSDGKPDIVAPCAGTDSNAHIADPLYSRERSRIFLSTESGRYTNTEIPGLTGYPHGATADDINGDGNTDVIFGHIDDMQRGDDMFIVRLGDGKGNFTIDNSRIALKHRTGTMGAHAWAVELIKLKGDTVPTLFISGAMDAVWCKNDGAGPCDTQPQMLKNVNGHYANPVVFPLAGVAGVEEALVDIVYDEKRNKIIVASEAGTNAHDGNGFYAHYSIDLSTKESKVVGSYTKAECISKIDPWYSMCNSQNWSVYGDFLEQRNADNVTKFNLNW
jgi:hypothetical protein